MSRTAQASLEALLTVGGRRTWEAPELPSLNRLQPRATLVPFPTPELAATLDPGRSPLHRLLDGGWEFRLVDRPAAAPTALRLKRGWDTVEVPSLWTMQGFERPHYTNVEMPFPGAPPNVPEDNPTGIYRRSFTVPRGWRRRRIVLGFGGVEGVLYVLVNGEPVGISKDGRTPAEFDVTDLVRHGGPNELVAVVVRWSDASFIEDQDQWWHAGLSRDVYLYATGATHIADVFARAGLDDDYLGTDSALARRVGRRPGVTAAALEARLLDPGGRTVATATSEGALERPVRAPSRWSAETRPSTPWSSRSASGRESVACRVGFRRIEIRDRQLLINGKPVQIQGVNHHDHDDTTGGCQPGADGNRRAADEAVQRQRRAHLPLS